MKSSEILLYNKGLFNSIIEDLKLEILEPGETLDDYMKNISWEEFIELCKTIYGRKSEITANTFEYSLAYDSDENFFITKLIQEEIGYSHVGSDEKGIINFDPDVDDNAFKKAKAYVKQYREYYDTGFFNTKGTLGTYASNDFKEQKTLFSVGSSGGAGYNFPAGSAFEVGVCKVPASKNNPQYVNQGLTLTFLKNSKYTDEMNTSKIRLAWQFAKYITNPSNNVELCLDSQGYLPVRKSAIETKEYQKFLLKDNDYARTAKVLINEINGRYFTSAVFKGSAELRAQTGAIFTESLLDKGSDIDAAIDRIFRQHINTAKTKF